MFFADMTKSILRTNFGCRTGPITTVRALTCVAILANLQLLLSKSDLSTFYGMRELLTSVHLEAPRPHRFQHGGTSFMETQPPPKLAHWANYWDFIKRRDTLIAYARSPEGQSLRPVMDEFISASYHRSTNKYDTKYNTGIAYKKDQATYLHACRQAGVDPLDPPLEWRIAFFEGYAVGRRFGTVSRLEAAVANYFFQNGQPSFTRTFTHKQLMRRLARQDKRPTRKARALYGAALKKLLRSYDATTTCGLRDLAIIIAGAIRALRAASIVQIHMEDVRFEVDGVVIALRNEKTATGNEPLFAATPHSASHKFCMPCVFRRLIDLMDTLNLPDGPLFRHIDRWGHISAQPLTPKAVTLILREGLRRAGIDEPQSYSSHSLRHGVVAAAVEQSYSDREIMLLTMHRSLKGLRAYTTSRDPWREAPKRLTLDDARAEPTSERHGWRHES